MKLSFSDHNPHVFSDGTVFLAVSSISLDKTSIAWSVPKEWFSLFEELSQNISPKNCMDSKCASKNARLLEQLLGCTRETINWRLSVNYEYTNPTPPQQSSISVLYNQVDELPNDIEKDRYSERYQKNKWATCHVEDSKIVSACHSYNSAISIETRPEYRRQGFGKACLVRIAKELLSDGLQPGYGTGYENMASRKTAESAGFDLARYQYWIEIPSDRRADLPAGVQSIITN